MKGINSLNGKFDNAGYIIESQGLSYVSYRFNSPPDFFGSKYHSAAYVSKGESALGSRFRIATFTNTPRSCVEYNVPDDPSSGCKTFGGNAQHFISVLATEDDTRVTLSDFENGIEFTNLDQCKIFAFSDTIPPTPSLPQALWTKSSLMYHINPRTLPCV